MLVDKCVTVLVLVVGTLAWVLHSDKPSRSGDHLTCKSAFKMTLATMTRIGGFLFKLSTGRRVAYTTD